MLAVLVWPKPSDQPRRVDVPYSNAVCAATESTRYRRAADAGPVYLYCSAMFERGGRVRSGPRRVALATGCGAADCPWCKYIACRRNRAAAHGDCADANLAIL